MRLSLLCLSLAACVPVAPVRQIEYQTTPTTRVAAPSRPDNCTFDLLRLRPDRPFEELAVLESSPQYADSLGEFRAQIATQVCRAGGDAVIAHPNSDGYYPGGVIIRYTAS